MHHDLCMTRAGQRVQLKVKQPLFALLLLRTERKRNVCQS